MLSEVNKSQRSHCRKVEKIKIGGVFADFVDFCYFLLQIFGMNDIWCSEST